MSTTQQWKHAGTAAVIPGDLGDLITLGRAREALGLDFEEFDLALQLGEVPTVACGSRTWKVPARTVDRLCAEPGHPRPLLDRVRLVGAADAAKTLGVGRERFVRLARAGYIRPARWYVNRYRALVWLYPQQELPALAEQHPALLHGPLPDGLREAVAAGEDQRAFGWRSRRSAQLVRDAYDAWDEAAVWAALLGPEIVDTAVPDAFERAHLRRLRGTLPPGRTGLATPEQIRALTTAEHPDEITLALLSLADALHRARALRPAPAPALTPQPEGPPETPPTQSPAADSAGAPATPAQLPARTPAHAAPRPGRGRRLLRLLGGGRRSGGSGPSAPQGHSPVDPGQSSPTSVTRTTARPSSSEAERSTSAEMPQP